jgi:hypothetical protein
VGWQGLHPSTVLDCAGAGGDQSRYLMKTTSFRASL